MPRKTIDKLDGKLRDLEVRQAKPRETKYKLGDGHGLNLEVWTNGAKYWRLAYRYAGKQKTLAIGVYPTVSLSEAREAALKAKKLIRNGVDPSLERRREKAQRTDNTFSAIAKDWHDKASGRWSKGHADNVWRTLEVNVLPHIGDMVITGILSRDVLHVVKRVEERGALDVASRIKQRIGSVFRYAIQTGLAEHNPADQLKDVVKTRKVTHRKALALGELPTFLKELEENRKLFEVTRLGIAMIVHTFVRPGELRFAEWSEFDLDNALWRIPAEKMKVKEEHLVPLSSQVLGILKQLEEISGRYQYVFPGAHDFRKPMSENALTYAIRKRLGFDATAHGFRSVSSTILNEAGYRVDVIERQLAHSERNKVRAAYNRSQYLAERTEMMQWYSDYLDAQRAAADGEQKVVPIFTGGAR